MATDIQFDAMGDRQERLAREAAASRATVVARVVYADGTEPQAETQAETQAAPRAVVVEGVEKLPPKAFIDILTGQAAPDKTLSAVVKGSGVYLNGEAYDANKVFLRYPSDSYYGEGEVEQQKQRLSALDTNKDGFIALTEAENVSQYTLLAHRSLVTLYFAATLEDAKQELAKRRVEAQKAVDKAAERIAIHSGIR